MWLNKIPKYLRQWPSIEENLYYSLDLASDTEIPAKPDFYVFPVLDDVICKLEVTVRDSITVIPGNIRIITGFRITFLSKQASILLRSLWNISIKNNSITSVAYSSQRSHTGQVDFCNWLTDGSTKALCG